MQNQNDFKLDLAAGFSVALVALPLSIGIALASGAPASSGIIAAVIGGLIGSWLGGGHVNINGPAAGLIVIVLDAIVSLGAGDMAKGYRGMLAASVAAGLLQVIMGRFKLGRKGAAFPTSVIHGMMAAIGIIIIAKQVHVLLGHTPIAKNPIMLLAEIPFSFSNFDPTLCTIGVTALIFLVVWSRLPFAFAKKIPGPLLAVIIGSIMASYVGLAPQGLLKVPSDFSQWIMFPDFSVLTTFAGWKAAITIALVASLETVLSASAVDKLDPQKRKTDLDKDLLSKGVCNMLSAGIGGLPMIAEIVRSSANVSYGARTWKANFFHSGIVLTMVLAIPFLLAKIPLPALAAILVMVGSRLGSPAHFLHAKKIGYDNLVGFAVTMVVTLAVDLLVGIFAGAAAQFAIEMWLGLKVKNLVHADFERKNVSDKVEFDIRSSLTFSNFLELQDQLTNLANERKSVNLELVHSEYVDHSVMEGLETMKDYFQSKNVKLDIHFSEQHQALGSDHLSAKKKVA